MVNAELWLTYQLASRAHLKTPSTTQLIELEFQNQKLVDLEDVLDHVFRQGFIEGKYRPATWWEKKDGQKVKGSLCVDDLLQQGVGRCSETALKLIVQDIPTALWFTYVYRHSIGSQPVSQRVKLAPSPTSSNLDRFANVTNYIFNQGYLAANLRSVVHWQQPCGMKIEEGVYVQDVLSRGVGTCEEKPLRLFVDAPVHPQCPCAAVHVPHHKGCSPGVTLGCGCA